MPEKTKLVKLPLKVWQVAKISAVERDQSLTQWLVDAIGLKLNAEREEKK